VAVMEFCNSDASIRGDRGGLKQFLYFSS